MNELVFKTTALSTAEPYTTSEVIAEYSENSHHAIQQLISKNKDNLEEFGILAFEMRKLKPGRGAKAKIYHLNEQQTTFLITLLKNTPNVVAFKSELTRQFYATRKELQERHSLRLEDKSKRKNLTDAIRDWSLKGNYPQPYSMLTNLLCKNATGSSCKQLKEKRGADASVTELMTVEELETYQQAENKVIAMLSLNADYQQIKALLNGGTLQVAI
ncbi:Rha family transcriptional regulator [Ligilactobacillus aviarius]|nr:Rha family transcriptional regulator [Ligilactobacillus aviarius]MBM6862441.1 Rha family transcriptional regulator [Ligilactobacillus aviarius]